MSRRESSYTAAYTHIPQGNQYPPYNPSLSFSLSLSPFYFFSFFFSDSFPSQHIQPQKSKEFVLDHHKLRFLSTDACTELRFASALPQQYASTFYRHFLPLNGEVFHPFVFHQTNRIEHQRDTEDDEHKVEEKGGKRERKKRDTHSLSQKWKESNGRIIHREIGYDRYKPLLSSIVRDKHSTFRIHLRIPVYKDLKTRLRYTPCCPSVFEKTTKSFLVVSSVEKKLPFRRKKKTDRQSERKKGDPHVMHEDPPRERRKPFSSRENETYLHLGNRLARYRCEVVRKPVKLGRRKSRDS